MSSFFKQSKSKKGFAIKPKGAERLRQAMSRVDSRIGIDSAPSLPGQTSNAPSGDVVAPPRRSCPNPQCPRPQAAILDGYCSACGREIDTSNIVAEVQFGETSAGAAVVQGSFIGADQAAARTMGPGMRRIGGVSGSSRERTIREAKQMMQSYAQQLRISDTVVNEGVQIFKLAIGENWVQGRGMIRVVPVCLYAACRRQERCRVMLIDFSDLVKVNVYELGHVFKQLNEIYDFGQNQVKSIIPEDLMYRFADKLDFGDMTSDVANFATRLCQRMGLDWMVMGRRPSGICGACLHIAAQNFGFRRTVREIVYIVKVTMHTIEQRLGEFKMVESADLTIEDFLKQELLESRHDPPSYYKKQAEWQEKVEREREESGRKRKIIEDIDDEEAEVEEASPGGQVHDTIPQARGASQSPQPPPSDLSSSSTAATDAARAMPPPPLPLPDTSKLRPVTDFLQKSVDPKTGERMIEAFDPKSIPAAAPRIRQDPEVEEGLSAENPTDDAAVNNLAEMYAEGDSPAKPKRRGRRKEPAEPLINFNEEWERDEGNLERQINEVISDPHSTEHAKALATAAHHARVKAAWARSQLPDRTLRDEEMIDPSEFADDPEVENCLLNEDEIAVKELIWLNTNKDWLRKQQDKEFRKQMEELGPKKKRRNRQKRPRIGEGQLTPASTPGEAAVAAMKKFTVSNRINLEAIRSLFPQDRRQGPGSVVESLRTSRAESEVDSTDAGGPEASRQAASSTTEKGKEKEGATNAAAAEEEDDEEEAYEEVEDEDGGIPTYDDEDGEAFEAEEYEDYDE